MSSEKKWFQQKWDAIVIGTGMGGGTAGFALAKAGQKVLFIEKGISHLNTDHRPLYGFPEDQFSYPHGPRSKDGKLLKQAGRMTDSVLDISKGSGRDFIPLLGSGLGGSSSLYGAALERFYPEDFAITRYYADAPGASLVDWPFSYSELEPFYEEVETLYDVAGSPDPLRKNFQKSHLTSRSLSPCGVDLFQHLEKRGLHPYRLPTGHADPEKCPGCQGTLCPQKNKAGSAEKCVMPAISEFGAHLLEEAEVLEIVGTDKKAHAIKVRYQNEVFTLEASRFFLGGGALFTPKLLLTSKSNFWPKGFGNSHDLVGKNLMRHYMDLHAVINNLKGRYTPVPVKELAFNDFYFHGKKKYGTVQSLGNYPTVMTTLGEMQAESRSRHPILSYFTFPFEALSISIAMKLFCAKSTAFATIMEDVPYATNQVSVSDEMNPRVQINYKISAYEKKRIKEFRKLVADSFKPYTTVLLAQAENNQRLAHACGTCRMGEKPETSVVDPFGRMHEIENVYIVDSSVFPTGSGINPALTIAALALRTVSKIVK